MVSFYLFCHFQPARASLLRLDHVSSVLYLDFLHPRHQLGAYHLGRLSRGVARVTDHDNQGCPHLLCASGPLPGYAADTADPQLRHVPVLQVSHIEEEGKTDSPWGMYRLGTDMRMGICHGT